MHTFPFRCATPLHAALCWCIAACGSSYQGGAKGAPEPAGSSRGAFDVTSVYREMGFFAAREPLPFVAAVRFLAGPAPDSTLAVFGVSLSSESLSFRRSGAIFEARYRVEISASREDQIVGQVSSDQTVRVATFQETQRTDESVVFQQLMTLAPGPLFVSVALRDRYGAEYNRVDGPVVVPQFAEPALAAPVLVYRGARRTDRSALPDLVVNPRATVSYGSDTITLYLEAYGGAPERSVVVRALSKAEQWGEVWRDTVPIPSSGMVGAAVVRVPPRRMAVGDIRVEAFRPGATDTVHTDALVSLSDRWLVPNFEEIVLLLRYIGHDDALRRMREADVAHRAELWNAFWEATDPDPQSPENEALETYFERLQEANERFGEEGEAGWLTDRGEVLITLGEPDETFDSRTDLAGGGVRQIRWIYGAERLALYFVDESGLGTFRLTAASRADYLRAVERLRRGGEG